MNTIRVRGDRVLGVTDHAVERYLERVLAFNGDDARAYQHMARLAERVGVYTRSRPEWALDTDLERADYVLLGPDIALVVVDGDRVVTCLARGSIPTEVRAHRNRRRRGKRAARRRHRQGAGASEGPMRRERRDAMAEAP